MILDNSDIEWISNSRIKQLLSFDTHYRRGIEISLQRSIGQHKWRRIGAFDMSSAKALKDLRAKLETQT